MEICKRTFTFVVSPHHHKNNKIIQPQSAVRQTAYQSTWGHCVKPLPNTLSNVQVCKDKERLRNCPQPEKLWRHKTYVYGTSEWGSWILKTTATTTLGQIMEIWVKMDLARARRWVSTYRPNLRTKLESWKSLWKERIHMPCTCTQMMTMITIHFKRWTKWKAPVPTH